MGTASERRVCTEGVQGITANGTGKERENSHAGRLVRGGMELSAHVGDQSGLLESIPRG